MEDFSNIQFNVGDEANHSIIKVIGVGGGGGNAVNHMFNEGIHDVSFVVCNTDRQALADSPIPTRVQLGTEGLGAGNIPAKARKAAEESIDDIRRMLNDGTRMVFITAGMGGGTGTGAAPIIAKCAKEMGILTVGIVTIPFHFEGNRKIDQALDGVDEIAQNVDALLVINNERLREIYPQFTVRSAFAKADDTLCVAAKSIAEIITLHGIINLDFQDVTTILKDGGVALISTGEGEGENRVTKALDGALHSPLLNNNDVFKSKKVMFAITFNPEKEDDELAIEEMNEINDFMAKFEDMNLVTKWGLYTDASLGRKVKVTLLTSGFGIGAITGMEEKLTREEEEQRLREEEERERQRQRRAKYYGISGADRGATAPVHCFIFETDELDNDNIISDVEESATYNRKSSFQHDTRNKQNGASHSMPSASQDAPTHIVFNMD